MCDGKRFPHADLAMDCCCTDQQKAARFKSDFCGNSYVATLLKTDLVYVTIPLLSAGGYSQNLYHDTFLNFSGYDILLMSLWTVKKIKNKKPQTNYNQKSVIIDTCTPNVWFLYVTIIVVTLTTTIIIKTLLERHDTGFLYIKLRAVVFTLYAHAVVGCFELLFSLYFSCSETVMYDAYTMSRPDVSSESRRDKRQQNLIITYHS